MMIRAEIVVAGLMAMVLALFHGACAAKEDGQRCSTPSSCGELHNIGHPFRLIDGPPECRNDMYELACENNRTTLNLYAGKYYVQGISYDKQAMRVIDASLDEQDICSLPRYSLTDNNISCYKNPYSLRGVYYAVFFLNCTRPLVNSPLFVDFTPCINNSSSPKTNLYAFYGDLMVVDVPELCTIQVVVPSLFSNTTCHSVLDIHRALLKGFDLSYGHECEYGWLYVFFWTLKYFLFSYKWMFGRWFHYYIDEIAEIVSYIIKGFILWRTFLGMLFLIALSIYKFRRRNLSDDDRIEEFLQSHSNFKPIRYSYSQIKGITNGFKDKLGQGGYGSVYKGKLRSGHLVAVKVLLGTSKANGQDFINEVATIGRVYHVNIMRLVGFCVEGSKRALIYELMANGSLDKFIFYGEKINPLSWERMYEIGLGVACGIEYLHRGCDMQILHFDIKPHNILLNENFIPKISDFGLAKLYQVDESIVSLTAARGTPGYIAPELFYKNIGGISYKADVYSFGMLLMEMTGKRKNVNAFAEHSSQIYFPSWVYDQISQAKDIELGDATEDEKKIIRKMIIVALWCTQMKPMDRPSMSEVLGMLEGEVELLQIPPKPLLNPQERSIVYHANNIPTGAPISTNNDIGTITLDGR